MFRCGYSLFVLGRQDLPSVSQVVREKLLQSETRMLININRSILYAQPPCMHGISLTQ